VEILVQRWFPTFDFIIRTQLTRAEAQAVLEDAMREPSTRSWPSPKPHLSGTVEGGTFTCRPRTSAFGGNAVPNVSGQLIPRADGGTDVLVRVINWFVYLMFGLVVGVLTYVALTSHATRSEIVKGALVFSWLLLCAAGIYAGEVSFVKKIFVRLFTDGQAGDGAAGSDA
jgi:hypothetical protein